MFETFLNAIIISIMVSVICDNPLVIRNDRVYRYVGNGSDHLFNNGLQTNEALDVHNSPLIHSTHQSLTTRDVTQNIPESILIKMKDITNASDFIATFLTAADNTAHKDVYLEYLERGTSDNISNKEMDVNEERRKLTKLPKIAAPAGCVPEMKIIELQPLHTSNELYFPSCVRMSRCSGCCPSQRLQCLPVSTSYEDITVIGVKYSTSERRLKFEGFKVFRIEKHDKCLCDCIQKAIDCKPNQIYSESECRCLCPNITEANECQNGYNKYWDHNQCQCKCKSVSFCSTGLLFNNMSCRCDIEEESISSHSEDLSDTTDTYNKLVAHRYVPDKEDTEIQVQSNKGLDILNGRGINPDIDDDYHENIDF